MASVTASSSVSSRVVVSGCSMAVRAAAAHSPAVGGGDDLEDLVVLEVVLEVDTGVQGSIRLLRLVLEVYLGERQAHGLRNRASGTTVGDAGDDDVFQLDDEVLLLGL